MRWRGELGQRWILCQGNKEGERFDVRAIGGGEGRTEVCSAGLIFYPRTLNPDAHPFNARLNPAIFINLIPFKFVSILFPSSFPVYTSVYPTVLRFPSITVSLPRRTKLLHHPYNLLHLCYYIRHPYIVLVSVYYKIVFVQWQYTSGVLSTRYYYVTASLDLFMNCEHRFTPKAPTRGNFEVTRRDSSKLELLSRQSCPHQRKQISEVWNISTWRPKARKIVLKNWRTFFRLYALSDHTRFVNLINLSGH